jgi:septum formation protein
MKLILASSSPRRKELLASIGIVPSEIMHPDVDESLHKDEDVREYVKRVALLKARAVHSQVPDAYVIAADTTVEQNRRILMKPEDREEARLMLSRLSGKRHRVMTGVCVLAPNGKEGYKMGLTRVSFKRLSQEEMNDYLDSKEWEGRAGGYSIQDAAAKFVKNINGSYSNIVGLPLYETDCLLKGLGFRG